MREATLIPTPFGACSPMSVTCSSAPSSGRRARWQLARDAEAERGPDAVHADLDRPEVEVHRRPTASKRNSEPVGVRFGCTCTAIVCTRTRPKRLVDGERRAEPAAALDAQRRARRAGRRTRTRSGSRRRAAPRRSARRPRCRRSRARPCAPRRGTGRPPCETEPRTANSPISKREPVACGIVSAGPWWLEVSGASSTCSAPATGPGSFTPPPPRSGMIRSRPPSATACTFSFTGRALPKRCSSVTAPRKDSSQPSRFCASRMQQLRERRAVAVGVADPQRRGAAGDVLGRG